MKTADLAFCFTRAGHQVYTYYLPESIQDMSLFGRRALVDVAGRKQEGFVIAEKESGNIDGLKPVMKVLDDAPLFDEKLLSLASWIAERYWCSLYTALTLMVPQGLKKKKSLRVISGLSKETFDTIKDDQLKLDYNLFSLLWEEGQISLAKAIEIVGIEEIKRLEKKGHIFLTGSYRPVRTPLSDFVYCAGEELDENFDFETLSRRAPRQAEMMKIILEKECDAEYIHANFNSVSIKSLLKKGYIQLKRSMDLPRGKSLELTSDQKQVIESIEPFLHKEAMQELLLFGITGSGKTEIYIKTAEEVLKTGKGVIVLVPEIALTRQLVEVFSNRIPNIAVLHSGMSQGERYEQWKRIQNNQARLVLGARSAIFAPVQDLGLIIIDEEQENSYKQEEFPRYHAREVARARAEIEQAVLLLGSATPSVETFFRAVSGESKLLCLPNRIGEARIPEVIIEDLKFSFKGKARQLLSPLLQTKIEERLRLGEQTILFINRRGYSPMTICWECGTIATCPNCSVGMTYHEDLRINVCHYCNHREPAMQVCQSCGSSHLQKIGAGTQKVEEEVKKIFPGISVRRLDLDSSRQKGTQQEILDGMKDGTIDVLIGTQMVAKGLDFSGVSLVGIVDADSILNLPDFRAGERCFQLLVQAAGRAGRNEIPGEVVIQTFNPESTVIQQAALQDYMSFYTREIQTRKLLQYPPFSHLLRVVVSAGSEDQSRNCIREVLDYLQEVTDASEEEMIILGPAPCPICKIKGRYRNHFIVKSQNRLLLHSIGQILSNRELPEGIKAEIEINPILTM